MDPWAQSSGLGSLEQDSDYEQDDNYNQEYEQEKQRLLAVASKLETGPFANVVCSYILYICSNDIKRYGYVFNLT